MRMNRIERTLLGLVAIFALAAVSWDSDATITEAGSESAVESSETSAEGIQPEPVASEIGMLPDFGAS